MLGSMHEIAARRGEGLRPQFLKLFSPMASNVIDLVEFQRAGFAQSGPNPIRVPPDILPPNVVLFPFASPSSDFSETGPRGRAPRIGRAKRLTGRNT